MPSQLGRFLTAYVEAALWSSTDNATESGGEPLDKNYGREDIAPDTLARMRADCESFLSQADELIDDNYTGRLTEWDVYEQAGHDFWLTRNGHGCGFWDGDWAEPAATVLTKLAKKFGECDLIIGDDGLIHGN